MQTLSLAEHLDTPDEEWQHLIDIATVDAPQRTDYERRNDNVLSGKPLCDTCDGTGNDYFHMYHRCSDCGGSGLEREEQ